MVAGNRPATIAVKDEAPGKHHQQKQNVVLTQIQRQVFPRFHEAGKKWTQVHWRKETARSAQGCFVGSVNLKDVSKSKEQHILPCSLPQP